MKSSAYSYDKFIANNSLYKKLDFKLHFKYSNAVSTFVCQSVGIERERAIDGFLYSYTSSTITNCVKSIPLSQTQGQQLLYKSYDIFVKTLHLLLYIYH